MLPSSDRLSDDEQLLIERALRSASDTRLLLIESGLRRDAASVFEQQFASRAALIVADENTLAAGGRDVRSSFERNRHQAETFVFGPDVYADDRCVSQLSAALAKTDAIPVAVGSGTINDVTKLAAHRAGRPYMVVATAASMDGYTAYGASITAKGSKQTFDCPAPQAVLADLEVIQRAPAAMNAAGYADLLAKIPAGADWIVADASGVEPIDSDVWSTVQQHLHAWVDAPEAIARGEPAALRRLLCGLMMTGFAMQAAKSSRPASGAEHQFSHLWDMQHHTHEGAAPSHGFKVGIGTLASTALYEDLLERDFTRLDIDAAIAKWPALGSLQRRISEIFGRGDLAETALRETAAKYVSADDLRGQLSRLRAVWPELRERLWRQLFPLAEAKAMLQRAGAAFGSEQIGISRDRLRQSFEQALFIRRRFTVLDLAHRTGLLDESLERLFA
jgi:glycerol-1-phosphate dehydrogenase [NAD(P)+]